MQQQQQTTAWGQHIQKIAWSFPNLTAPAWTMNHSTSTSVCTKQENLHNKPCLHNRFVFLLLIPKSSRTWNASLPIPGKVWLLSLATHPPNICCNTQASIPSTMLKEMLTALPFPKEDFLRKRKAHVSMGCKAIYRQIYKYLYGWIYKQKIAKKTTVSSTISLVSHIGAL